MYVFSLLIHEQFYTIKFIELYSLSKFHYNKL